MDSNEKRIDFIKRCRQICEAAGEDAGRVSVEKIGGLLYEIREMNFSHGETKPALEEAMADAYIAWMVLCDYYNLDYEAISKHIDTQIGR